MAPHGQPGLSCYSSHFFLCALFNHTQRPKIYSSESMEISLDTSHEAVPRPHPWENTLSCLRERQSPSQKNSWQDRDRVVGLSGHMGCPRSYTYRMF